jgi:hypothetical protein
MNSDIHPPADGAARRTLRHRAEEAAASVRHLLAGEAHEGLVASIEQALRSATREGDCCVPLPTEPFFVLLGRDPQAPDLVETWADIRAIAEPSSAKPGMARSTASAMRDWKRDNPGIGMPMARFDAVERDPGEASGGRPVSRTKAMPPA